MDFSTLPAGLTTLWTVLAHVHTEQETRGRMIHYGPLSNHEEAIKLAKGRGRDGADAEIEEGKYVILGGHAYRIAPGCARLVAESALHALMLHILREMPEEDAESIGLDAAKLWLYVFDKLSPADRQSLVEAGGGDPILFGLSSHTEDVGPL